MPYRAEATSRGDTTTTTTTTTSEGGTSTTTTTTTTITVARTSQGTAMHEDGRRRKFVETLSNLYIISYFMFFNNTFIRVGHAPQRLKKITSMHQQDVI